MSTRRTETRAPETAAPVRSEALEAHLLERGIALVGADGRFPGADDIDQFWQLLHDGVEAIAELTDAELDELGVSDAERQDPNFVTLRPKMSDVALFDGDFFRIHPAGATLLDPQHRVFLECAWSALERAGYDPKAFGGLIGVYAGVSISEYLMSMMRSGGIGDNPVEVAGALVHNDKDYLATRVAYKLDCRGPAVTVQSACSTGLVAVHMACSALRNGECDMALAGAASFRRSNHTPYLRQEGGFLSADGHNRSFDARASGSAFGSGAGVVVLRRLRDALEDGDNVIAVIRGSAVGNDGADRGSFAAPGASGQAEVIRRAQADAVATPDSISYIETHGSATPLGDVIEFTALRDVFGAVPTAGYRCALGSVKSNVGHLEAAAGLSALIKAALMLKHRQLVPSLHFETPNPQLEIGSTPFFVNTESTEWKAPGGLRRAGVNAFGIGGTNAHVVLEEPPSVPTSPPRRRAQLLVLSARSEEALHRMRSRLADHLDRQPDLDLADVAHTLQRGRRAFSQRGALVCSDREDAIAALRADGPGRWLQAEASEGERPTAFLFPGIGDHYPRMAHGLYLTEPVFRDELDRCSEILHDSLGGRDLRKTLFAGDPSVGAAGARDRRARLFGERVLSGPLGESWFAQPAVFSVDYALARLWQSWGVAPRALLGYSLGEYVAACIAGVFSLESALHLVARRAQLIQELPHGAMLAVLLPAAELRDRLGPDLALASINGESMTVAAGVPEAIDALATDLEADGVMSRRLPQQHAVHTPQMNAIAAQFRAELEAVERSAPRLPIASNVTGTWLTDSEAVDPGYWASHLCRTVRFADCLETLWQEEERVFIEVGPGNSLGSFAIQHPAATSKGLVVPSLPLAADSQPADVFALRSLGRLWASGVGVDWGAHSASEQRQRVMLPTYPFERRRYWAASANAKWSGAQQERVVDAGKKPNVADWFYLPSWTRALPRPYGRSRESTSGRRWLLLADPAGFGASLMGALHRAGHDVVVIESARAFASAGPGRFSVDPSDPETWAQLFDALASDDELPDAVVHCWSLDAVGDTERFSASQREGLLAIQCLAKSYAETRSGDGFELTIVASGLAGVVPGERPEPRKAPLLGIAKVVSQEYPGIRCRVLDVDAASLDAVRVAEELELGCDELLTAHRGRDRWIQRYEPVRLPELDRLPSPLRDEGTYLITGGLGHIGLSVAHHLAETRSARLVLLGRTPLPPSAEWQRYANDADDDDAVAAKIRAVQAIEAAGGQVLALSVDVSDGAALERAFAAGERRYGRIDGVFHAAGCLEGSAFAPLANLTQADCDRHFLPKADGTLALAAAIGDRPLDFVLLFSSLSAVLGGVSMCAYASANCVLNAISERQSGASATPWLSVCWDTWSFGAAKGTEQIGLTLDTYAMNPQEGLKSLEYALRMRDARCLVCSSGDLGLRIAQWVDGVDPDGAGQATVPKSERHPRPNVQNPYVAPSDPIEAQIAEIWSEALAVEPIGIHDNFFEIGGNSLLAMQVVSRCQRSLGTLLSVVSLFEQPTVHGLRLLLEGSDEKAVATAEDRGAARRERMSRARRRAAEA